MISNRQSSSVAKSCDNQQKGQFKDGALPCFCRSKTYFKLFVCVCVHVCVCAIKSASTQLCLRSIFLLDGRVSHKWAASCNLPSNQLCNFRANADISWKQIIRQCRFSPSFSKPSIRRDLGFSFKSQFSSTWKPKQSIVNKSQ